MAMVSQSAAASATAASSAEAFFLAFERRATAVAMAVACATLVVAATLGMFQVFARFILQQPAEWTEVLIRFSLIWMVFMGVPMAFREGAMLSVDLMRRLAPPLFRRVLEVFIMTLSITLLLIIVWYGWAYAQHGRVQTIIGLESYSMFWAYLALPVGSMFAIVGVIGNFLDPRHQELDTAL